MYVKITAKFFHKKLLNIKTNLNENIEIKINFI